MKKNNKSKKQIMIAICGIIVGFVNGFFGGGGGMVCVPMFEKYLKLENKKAHATTLCVILPLCIVSSFVYIYKNSLDFIELILVTAGAIIGGILGAFALKKLNSKWIRGIFAVIILVAGIKMVI